MKPTHCLAGTIAFALCCTIHSCSKANDTQTEPFTPQSYNISGKVEKGPFISGSTITMQPMNAKMQASGEMYTATIQDNIGNFSFGSKFFDAPFAELTATGYFFNEVRGELSSGMLYLRAIVDPSDESTVNVNVLTHMKYPRILKLVAKGSKFDAANKQAQEELFAAFGLSEYAGTDASRFSIVAGNDESAALIAVSSLLLVDRSEAETTEYLAKLCLEFERTGSFSKETKNQIKKDRAILANRLADVKSNIITRYEVLGLPVEVKDLTGFFDWDDDGTAGNETLKEGEEVSLETTRIEVPAEGGTYKIKISSPIPVYLKPIVNGDDNTPISPVEPFKDIYEHVSGQTISADSRIEDDILTVTVSRLESRTPKSATIPIYDCLGNELGAVELHQAGTPEAPLPPLGETGKKILDDLESVLANAFSAYNLCEQYYHENRQNNRVEQYIYPACGIIENCWESFYQAVMMNLLLKAADARQQNVYQPLSDVFSAMHYYHMVVAWGSVPYITDYAWYGSGNPYLGRTDATEILNGQKTSLEQAIGMLDEKKNDPLKDADGLFFVSKDVARMLLADIFMYQGDYDSAEPLLAEIIRNGYYELDRSNYSEKETIDNIRNNRGGKEILFALETNDAPRTGTRIQIPLLIPVQTYTDVVLSHAECLYKQGNVTEARKRLNKVTAAKGITVGSDDVLRGITEVRKQLFLYGVTNFAFMKRNGMAEEEYDVANYRLLLPIPQKEVIANPLLTQNPGY